MKKDRLAVQDELFKIRAFPGVKGTIWNDGKTGGPRKCVYIVKIVGTITGTSGLELVRTVCL